MSAEGSVLARERAALRRLGILAGSAAPGVVLDAMAEEVARLIDVETGATRGDLSVISRYETDALVVMAAHGDPMPVTVGSRWPLDGDSVAVRVIRTGKPARIDHYAVASGQIAGQAKAVGGRSAVGVPIVVDGELWGVAAVVSARPEPLPAETEDRLAAFAELAATAISAAHAREQARRLTEEQAALRRVATLVAQGVEPERLFAAVNEEIGRLLGADAATLVRYVPGGEISSPAAWHADRGAFTLPGRFPITPGGLAEQIAATGRPARVDDWSRVGGETGRIAREDLHARHSVGCPVVVDGGLWGFIGFHSARALPGADLEARLESFAQLVATAISNAESRADARRLAEEQAGLRRVATLVAEESEPDEVIRVVTAEAGRLYGVDSAILVTYEPEETVRIVASLPDETIVGRAFPLGDGVSRKVLRTREIVRSDDLTEQSGPGVAWARERLALRSTVGCPVEVDGELWGVLTVNSAHTQGIPPRTEERLASLAELLATAISNARARERLRHLADEQAALRRIATLVAREASPEAVFTSVVEEVGNVLGVSDARLLRYESDGTATVLASWGALRDQLPIGLNAPVDGRAVTALVLATGSPARIDDYDNSSGALAEMVRGAGLRSAVGCPVVVDGRLWGVTVAASVESEPLPADTEPRLSEFTRLIATALANIDARTALAESRVRIVAAADEARRRMERDLHDGAQQRLVSLALRVRGAEAMAPAENELGEALGQIASGLNEVLDALRELSRGIHPAVLSEAGLRAALRALARRCALPVRLSYDAEPRFDEGLEVTAYYVVSEALANVVKHSGATSVDVSVTRGDDAVRVVVADDGAGGATPARGSGLIGLIDRVEARGGTLEIVSPPGEGTTLRAVLPVLSPAPA